jgi:PilZ domain
MPRRKQLARRTRRRLVVHYGTDEPRYIGFSRNLSRSGIMLGAMHVFAPGTLLNMEVELPGGALRLRGQVIWAREGPLQWMQTGRVGMGITFINPPAELLTRVQPPA